MNKINIVIGFKNREIERVKRCLDSLNKQTYKDFEVIIIDYGSDKNIAKETKQLTDNYSFCKYVYNNTYGFPWNRSHALNSGIRLSTSEYVMTSDIDMIFDEIFIETIVKLIKPNIVLYSMWYLLPEKFNDYENINKYKNLKTSSNIHELGGCQIVKTDILREIGGFDEFFKIWGFEDKDINKRLVQKGLTVEWVSIDKTQIYHQWHPIVSHKNNYITPSGWYDMMFNYYKQDNPIKRNHDNWGRIYSDKDRESLLYLNNTKHDNIITFEFSYSKSNSIVNLINIFEKLTTNKALHIKFKEKHIPSKKITFGMRIIKILNLFLRKINIPHQLVNPAIFSNEYLTVSKIRDYIFYYILHNNEEKVKDYFVRIDNYEYEAILIRK